MSACDQDRVDAIAEALGTETEKARDQVALSSAAEAPPAKREPDSISHAKKQSKKALKEANVRMAA